MNTEVSSLADLGGDLAGTYRRTASSGETIDPAVSAADLATVQRDGYVILPDLLTAQELDEIREAVAPLLDRRGRNQFEGHTTQRVYSVLNKTRACDRIADHPRVLALVDRLLLPNYLLSMLQVINILPGEQTQMLHTDDGFYPCPGHARPSARRRSGRSTTSPPITAPPMSLREATFGAIAGPRRPSGNPSS